MARAAVKLGFRLSGGDEASRLGGRALAAGPDNGTCLASAAVTYGVLLNRFEEAFELANRALMLHPNSLFVRNKAAAAYTVCGESDKAIAQYEAACRMNPLDSKKTATSTFSVLAAALCLARRYEESVRAGRRALAFTPTANTARKFVAISLAQLGRTDEARAEIAELLKYQPDVSLALLQIGERQIPVDTGDHGVLHCEAGTKAKRGWRFEIRARQDADDRVVLAELGEFGDQELQHIELYLRRRRNLTRPQNRGFLQADDIGIEPDNLLGNRGHPLTGIVGQNSLISWS